MENVVIKRQKGIQGFIPVTWVVWKAQKLVGIFATKQQAQAFKQTVIDRQTSGGNN